MKEKIYVDGFGVGFFAITHLQKAPITANSENVPDSQSSAYRRKYHHHSKQDVLRF